MALGFFSFAKFLMYRDLDPATWPDHARISERPLVRGLLADGFDSADGMIPEDAKIDPFIPPSEMLHILDSDSSQARAVQGPSWPGHGDSGASGTGKSQTIANIVASAVADGRRCCLSPKKWRRWRWLSAGSMLRGRRCLFGAAQQQGEQTCSAG
jgi:hypothetical protein